MRGLGLAIALLVSSVGQVAAAAQSVDISPGATVYIDKMDSGFDVDIRAELGRQKVALQIVSSRDDAQLIVVGSETKNLTATKVPQGVGVTVRRTGTVMVQDKASGSALWSDTWRVGSYNPRDQWKEASRLVGNSRKPCVPAASEGPKRHHPIDLRRPLTRTS